ncbi:DUF4167 domain-containing protein [Pontibaca methylaminivorans]|uniref:DUF4167 domain-containing protein n=1 Tax=Pontibaca methylaminivorans TaxID=515897 RepID=UPI003FA7A700
MNRVFDSSGPEGKVRGTPQQIIDKYNQLARDAQLSNDRIATENFQQHAEHYLRLLSEAQREIDARREEHEARREEQERQQRERQAERDRAEAARQGPGDDDGAGTDAADEVLDPAASGDSDLVETPEAAPRKPPRRSPARSRRTPRKAEDKSDDGSGDGAEAGNGGNTPEAAE